MYYFDLLLNNPEEIGYYFIISHFSNEKNMFQDNVLKITRLESEG